MTLNEIFPDEAEFMDWLANNCYSCAKLNADETKYNYACEFENIISHSNLNKEIDYKLTRVITEKGKLCGCKNFVSPASRSPPLSMDLVE
ncbi:MAG: hypothetical protein KAS17_03530 [Victivallaceae bacterium]|nr:hypothetical protein [Victivallaceae bacterium]